MTGVNLFLELMETMNYLLVAGVNSHNVYDARTEMDYLFDTFEEFDGTPVSAPDTLSMLEAITTKISDMTPEAKQYFRMIETFQAENEIFLQDLPQPFEKHTIEQVQLMTGFFNILNDLLQAGITACTAYEARIKIDSLFRDFEQEHEEIETDDIEDNSLSHFFPNLADDISKLTLFPVYKVSDFNADI